MTNASPQNPLLEQFLSESSELLEGIGQKLMQLESAPDDQCVINELFRMVHTLKGNSGLFSFPEMTRVLHASEDLLGKVRNGEMAFSRELADRLLEAMDFIGILSDEIASTERIDASRAADSARLAESLRALMAESTISAATDLPPDQTKSTVVALAELPILSEIPEALRIEAFRRCEDGEKFHWIAYQPVPECFFQGDDPFYRARQTPGLLWGSVLPSEPLPPLAGLDTYRCSLKFHLLTAAFREELAEYFRYVPDQVEIVAVDPLWLAISECKPGNRYVNASDLVTGAPGLVEEKSPESIEEETALMRILTAQQQILAADDHPVWLSGRLKAVAAVLRNLANSVGNAEAGDQIEVSLTAALASASGLPLLEWMDAHRSLLTVKLVPHPSESESAVNVMEQTSTSGTAAAAPVAGDGIKFGRRAEDSQTGPRSLKVDQAKIDRIMNLIGELVVEKNALPYLAQRAEAQYGIRELSREIKGKYSVINRIADEMQDAIMQVRMMAVSTVFQRFPRLVRDTSRKLGKEVQLVLEGEQTEADKNIIEALADPLIHIVRNSLDHGLETPEVRRANGKPETGTITIRAAQQADRVVIEIVDDGKGIDPAVIKRKAYEKGLIDETALERMDDHSAINLIFAAGLSTAAVVSDLSGRGVGMDVVRTAVEKLNGSVIVESEINKGTLIRISLPLSMAVTQVMVIESDGQLFGVPMDHVIETVRVPRNSIHRIKKSMTAVLRGRVVPLKALNGMLGISAQHTANADDELSVLLVQAGGGVLGLLVDGFRETLGVIQKPMAGFLSNLSTWSGSALMGDGSVLMILNIREFM
jgi:two-component system, chemotaxis family, sensor kinase CheA